MKKLYQSEIGMYLIFGVLTTVVYFILRFLVVNLTGNSLLGVLVAQFGAIVFAFMTNKFFVFKDNNRIGILKQFIVFFIGRSVVLLLDLGITYVGVEKYASFFINGFHLNQLPYDSYIFNNALTKSFIGTPDLLNEFLFALFVQILAIVLNYVISKKKVFKKKA